MSIFPGAYYSGSIFPGSYYGVGNVTLIPAPTQVTPERVLTVTVRGMLDAIARHLLESDRGFSTGPWTRDEIVDYINNAQNEFVIQSGLLKEFGSVLGEANVAQYQDPPYALDVERISYNGKKLYPQTQQQLNMQKPNWKLDAARNPKRYHRDSLPSHNFRTWPLPTTQGLGFVPASASPRGVIRNIAGTLPYVSSGTSVGTLRMIHGVRNYFFGTEPRALRGASGVPRLIASNATNFMTIHDALPVPLSGDTDVVGVPPAFTLYVLYGALSRIWAKEGDGQDLKRSHYCKMRFDRGVFLAQRLIFGQEERSA